MNISSATQAACFIVDDEIGVRKLISMALSDLPLAVHGFNDVATVTNALRKCLPSLIFLDVTLGQSDAIEAIHALSEARFTGHVQLISGRDQELLEDVRLIGERQGLRMLSPLRKPFRVAEIRSIAERHLTAFESGAPPSFGLDLALKHELVELWYQPQVDLRSGLMVGAEGLARVRHPRHGLLSPASFLPGASSDSLIMLSEFAVARALHDWQGFKAAGHPVRLSVNVTMKALTEFPLVKLVRESRPSCPEWPGLTLELTEDQIVSDLNAAHQIATQLRIYDVQLSIDDFGTGFSSLARMREMPFKELKLDRGLVANCSSDPKNRHLCESAVNAAHALGATVVAEGIEQLPERDALAEMGCDMGQGYLFARPMSRDDIFRSPALGPVSW